MLRIKGLFRRDEKLDTVQMSGKRNIGQWIFPPPVAVLVGWATGSSAGAPAPAAWTAESIAAWCAVPYNLSFVVVGAVAGVGTFLGCRKWLDRTGSGGAGADMAPSKEVTDRLDQIIELLGRQALSPGQAREAAALAVGSLPNEASAAEPLVASFANVIATVSQSANPRAREAVALELGGNRDEAFEQLMALGESEASMSAERFRQAGALAAPTSVTKAIRAYARAADLEPSNVVAWIELRRLHEQAGSITAARRCAERAEQYASDPREAMVVQNELGSVALVEGRLDVAKAHFLRMREAAETLLDSTANDTSLKWELQRDLSVSHHKLGEVAVAAGHLGEAQEHYSRDIAIARTLAESNPDNTNWQRDLSVSHNRLGDVALADRKFDEAKEQYTESLNIRKRLLALNPNDIGRQRDLSVSHNRLGNAAIAAGDLGEALEQYNEDLEIAKGVAASDVENAGWQRDLSVSHNRIGEIFISTGEIDTARDHYRESRAICERLTAIDPHNPEWQRDLFLVRLRQAELAEIEGRRDAALDGFEAAEKIVAQLTKNLPDHPGYASDLTWVRAQSARVRGG